MTERQKKFGYLYNWTSLTGIVLTVIGFITGVALLVMDYRNPNSTIYSGLFTYFVSPLVLTLGLILVVTGWFRERRRRKGHIEDFKPMPVLDLNDRRHYIAFIVLVVTIFVFIVLSGIGSFSAYKYTESVAFCGTTCHEAMKPENDSYAHSPHANVRCVDCHIGPGAGSFVQAKLRGLHQVKAVLTGKFQRPIPTPIENLRPASETCYECHWPEKFFGNLEQTKTYFKADESNSAYTISYLLPVGGGDPRHGPAHGIHYHMSVEKKIEYIASDDKRQVIPWIRMTDHEGKVTVFQTTDKKLALAETNIAAAKPRHMDCMDCHNRPAHQYQTPNRALDLSMSLGKIDPSIPYIKKNCAKALLGDYKTQDEGLAAIEKQLHEAYPQGGAKIEAIIAEVKGIYSRNFFPEMKVDWRAYPDDIGHWNTPGCFRCHDGKHKSESGKVISRECKTCHTITSQNPGATAGTYVREGVEFKHPVEDDDGAWKEDNCCDCHGGAPDL